MEAALQLRCDARVVEGRVLLGAHIDLVGFCQRTGSRQGQ